MEVPKLIILLCCVYYSYASHHHHSHTIPVEGYETQLENLGQHVEIPETPVKIIKITKTVAIKVPVPYPVKVIQKVPYPVHVSKPYPVPVPQIIHVPTPTHKYSADDHSSNQGGQSHDLSDLHSFGPAQGHSFGGVNSGHGQNIGSFGDGSSSEGSHSGSSYDAPSQSYYGNQNHEGSNSLESQSYDHAIQEYLQKVNPSNTGSHSSAFGGYH